MASNSSFLEIGLHESDLIRNILAKPDDPAKETTPSKTVKPEPGFCIKTRDGKGRKVFINICKSRELPPPKDISKNELIAILESEDPSDYRVPMSLGDPHEVSDKGGQKSTAFDIVVNTDFYTKAESSELFNTFLITVSMDGLDDKHNVELNRNDWIILKNKKYFGEIKEVNIVQRPKPLITELKTSKPDKPLISEVKTMPKEHLVPEFILRKQFEEGRFKSVLAEVKLPGVKCAADIVLDVGGDRVVLEALKINKEVYKWDVFLPVNLNPTETVAQYHRSEQVLRVTLPITDPIDAK